jgi:NAD(P)-dependent dehydrogenase (short-subunit alcohol dehydrogenase family)
MTTLRSRLLNTHRDVTDQELERTVAGKLVLVTGASHGIGRALSERLARAGAELLMVARSQDVLEQLAAELGPRAHACPADLSEPADVARLLTELQAGFPTPDFVVSNAGKSIRRSIAESYERMHDFTRTIAINYLGPVQLLLGLLEPMRERGSGHIVNVSTLGVLLPPAPRWAAYISSKAAFDVWLRSTAAETARDGVTATSIYLGLVHTRMSAPTDDFNNVPGLKPEQAAGVICQALVHRPSRIAPWWASGGAAFGAIARGPSDAAMRHYGRRIDAGTGRKPE